jgi:hypothetical protein
MSALGYALPVPVASAVSDAFEVFGPEIGAHSRSAVGMAELPFNIPVEIEADVEIAR